MKLIRGNAIHTPEFHKRKQKERRIKGTLWTLLAIALIALPIILARVEALYISSYKIEGNAITRDEDISKIVDEELSGSYLWILPKKNSFIYPKRSLEEALMTRIPRLSSVELSVVDQSLEVLVTEREPLALYCSDISHLNTPAGCYFLDEKGFIFSQAPSFSGDVYFIYTRPEPIAEPLGKEFMPEDKFRPIPQFVKDLENLEVHARALLVEDEMYSLILPSGGKIIWNAEDDLGVIYSNLEAFLLDDSIASQQDFLERILYIDLKFENRVFFKFQS